MQSMMVASQAQLLRKRESFTHLSSPPSPVEMKHFSQSMDALNTPKTRHSSGRLETSASSNNNEYVVIDSDKSNPNSPEIKTEEEVRLRPKKPLATRKSNGGSSGGSWLGGIFAPTYRQRAEEFKKLFSESIPSNERLVVDYSCALQKEALIHGRVYVSLNYLCFYANIFKWETRVVVKCKDIASLTKTNTAKLIPNAIQVTTNDGDRHTLTSFIARDKSYVMMFRVWQNALLDQPMSSSDLWSWVHFSYGEDLGFSSDEEEELKGDFANEFKHVRKSDASGSTSSDESKTDQAVEKSIRRATKRMSSNVDAIHENEIDEEDDDDEDDGDGDDEEEPDSLTLLQAVECPCSEHQGRTLADKTFPIPVDAVFTLLFSESKFYKNMQAEREAINLVFEPWQEISPSENGASKKRVLRFTVMSPHPMVKSAPTIETQFLQEYRPGELYTVMSECVSKDVPYCDSFFVRTKYCLTRGRQENETRLLIHAEVIITGNSWSFRLARGLVEKSAFGGVTDFINDLIAALNKYCNEGPSIISDITGAVELENIRRPSLTSKTDSLRSRESLRKILEVVNRPQLPESTARRLSQSRSRTSSLQALLNAPEEYISIRVIIGIVVFLFLIIIFLYVQVWNLEKAADAYERLLKSSLASNAGHLTHPSHYQSVQGLRKILAKAIEMAQMIERNLQDLESDLEEFTPTF